MRKQTNNIKQLKNGPSLASFCIFSVFFKQTIKFLQQTNVKKCHVHPIFGAGIQTHHLSNMSRLR